MHVVSCALPSVHLAVPHLPPLHGHACCEVQHICKRQARARTRQRVVAGGRSGRSRCRVLCVRSMCELAGGALASSQAGHTQWQQQQPAATTLRLQRERTFSCKLKQVCALAAQGRAPLHVEAHAARVWAALHIACVEPLSAAMAEGSSGGGMPCPPRLCSPSKPHRRPQQARQSAASRTASRRTLRMSRRLYCLLLPSSGYLSVILNLRQRPGGRSLR